MKMKTLISMVIIALTIIAMPAQAQSRKDKKAAKKQQWEMEQRQKFIEDSIRNQMRIDSLKNIQKIKEDEAAKDRADRVQKEADAKYSHDNEVTDNPCQIYDDSEWFAATNERVYQSKNINTVSRALLRSTQQQLFEKLSSKIKQVTADYFDQMDAEDLNYERNHIESAALRAIKQMVGDTYETCRKQSKYVDADGYYHMYMSIKISKKEIIEKCIDEIKKEQEQNIRLNEEKFRKSAFKVFEQDF